MKAKVYFLEEYIVFKDIISHSNVLNDINIDKYLTQTFPYKCTIL